MKGRHEVAFDELVMRIVNTSDDVADEEAATAYLMSIASSFASIADSLERFVDQSNPHRKPPGSSLSGY